MFSVARGFIPVGLRSSPAFDLQAGLLRRPTGINPLATDKSPRHKVLLSLGDWDFFREMTFFACYLPLCHLALRLRVYDAWITTTTPE
jgi:hypothetical protein